MSYSIHCTKKLLDRIKPSSISADRMASTLLGNWYATVLFWKPQVALVINEKTLLPVLMPLAPATSLAVRFPEHLAHVLDAHGIHRLFIQSELAQMHDVDYAKTSSRSVLGVMNQFAYLAEGYRQYLETENLLELSLQLAQVPCSPLYQRGISPDKELLRWIKDNWLASA